VDVLKTDGASAAAQVGALVRAARDYEVLVLNGSLDGRLQPMATLAIGRLRRPPKVVLTDATWKAGEPGASRAWRRTALRFLDRAHVHYCVLSTSERRRFGHTWNVDPARVHFTPWYTGLPDDVLADPPSGDDGHVFAGGDSLRDYGPLLAAADRLTAPLVIASRTLGNAAIPQGVQAGPVSSERFDALSARAACVVVALQRREDRSAGQFTYLNAMALGRPVVVTDTPGVRDYIDHERTGLVVAPGDVEAMVAAVNWTVAPETRAAAIAMGARAREDVLARFSADHYVARLLEVIGEVRNAG
jgi:hypothetical protein